MGQTKHDKIAKRIAKQERVPYNKGKGPDIKSPERTIEVAVSPGDLKKSLGQLKGFKKPYLATSSDMIPKAKEITKDTKIGVMGPTGHITKRAGGGKK